MLTLPITPLPRRVMSKTICSLSMLALLGMVLLSRLMPHVKVADITPSVESTDSVYRDAPPGVTQYFKEEESPLRTTEEEAFQDDGNDESCVHEATLEALQSSVAETSALLETSQTSGVLEESGDNKIIVKLAQVPFVQTLAFPEIPKL